MTIEWMLPMGFLCGSLCFTGFGESDLRQAAGGMNDKMPLMLQLSVDARTLHLSGADAGARYAVVAGLERTRRTLPNGVLIEVEPLLLAGAGTADRNGRAEIGIDLRSSSGAGDIVYLQAAAWPGDGEAVLPDRTSGVLATALRDPSSIERVVPGEPQLVVIDETGLAPSVELASTDGLTPEYTVGVRVTVPTGGYRLLADPAAIGGRQAFTVFTVEMPAPGEVVTEGFTSLHAAVWVGGGLDRIEVRIRARQRIPPVGIEFDDADRAGGGS